MMVEKKPSLPTTPSAVGRHLLIYSHGTSVRYFPRDLTAVSLCHLGFFLRTFSQHSAGTETLHRGGLVAASASASVFLKESGRFAQVHFHLWLMGVPMYLHDIPPGTLPKAQLLGVPDCSSELVFCLHSVGWCRSVGPNGKSMLCY